MLPDVESAGEQIVSDDRLHHVREILSPSRGNDDVASRPEDVAQRVLGGEAAKDVAGADEQDARHMCSGRPASAACRWPFR